MSAFARQWNARIAPIDEPQLVRDEGEWVYESYAPGAFAGWSKREIPVCINHDEKMPIGFVDCVIQHSGWHVAAFRLDRSLPGSEVAAEYLKPGMGVSLGGRSYVAHRDQDRLCHRVCLLDEVSVLGAGVKPQYTGAEIRRSMQFPERTKPEPKTPLPKSPAAVTTSSERAAAGEASEDYRPPLWDNLERIVGYRVTDANQEQAFLDASRRPLDRLYDEYKTAKRTEPQVIHRPGIGQVLGVR